VCTDAPYLTSGLEIRGGSRPIYTVIETGLSGENETVVRTGKGRESCDSRPWREFPGPKRWTAVIRLFMSDLFLHYGVRLSVDWLVKWLTIPCFYMTRQDRLHP